MQEQRKKKETMVDVTQESANNHTRPGVNDIGLEPSATPKFRKTANILGDENIEPDYDAEINSDDVSIDSVDREFIENLSWDTNSQEFIKSNSNESEEEKDNENYDFMLHNYKKCYLRDTLPKNWINRTTKRCIKLKVKSEQKLKEKEKKDMKSSDKKIEKSKEKVPPEEEKDSDEEEKKDVPDSSIEEFSSYDFEYNEKEEYDKHMHHLNKLQQDQKANILEAPKLQD